jgi:predicted MFS family arabinose efflux permease
MGDRAEADNGLVILVVAFGLGLLAVPVAGGSLRALGSLRLRRPRVLAVAFVVQLIALKAPLPHGPAVALNLASYLLGAWYLLANLNLPGMWLVAVGTSSNLVAMLANGGVMPASPKALAAAGLSTGGNGFVNSTVVPNAQISFLGDTFSIPHWMPFHNVFSIGDLLILMGGLVAVHQLCGSRLFPRGNAGFRKLRANRDFMSLWTAQAASNLGDWVYTMAVFASLGRNAKPHVFAMLLLAEVGPSAATGILGGPLVDRLPRRAVMVGADVVRAGAVATLFVGGHASLAHLYLVAACLGVMRALAQPALQASLPNVVGPDELVAANALVSATYHSAVMIGPVIGGLLAAHLGPEPAFAINALSFAGSALLVMRVSLPPQPPTGQWNPVAELREGLRYSLSTPLVRGLMIVIGMVMVGAAIKNPTEPAFVFQRLHGNLQTLGLITGVWGIGMVTGTVLAPSAVRAWKREQLLWGGIAVVGLCLLAASRAAAVAPVLMLYLFAGAGNGLGSVCYETLLQERTPDALRGRVLAACDAVFDLALLGGYLLTGVLDTRFGPRAMFAIAGTVFVAAAVASRMLISDEPAAESVEEEPASEPVEVEVPAESPVDVAVDVAVELAVLAAAEGSVAVLRVQSTEQLLARGPAPDVLGDASGQAGDGHRLGAGGMRRDDAVGGRPERVPVGERLGVGDVESRAADPALVEGSDQVVGDDVRAPGHIDKPGVVGHGPQLGLGHNAGRLGREGQGQDDGVGPRQRLVQPVLADNGRADGAGEGAANAGGVCPTCAWLGLSADECCLNAEGGEQPQQRLGDAARAQDGDPGLEERMPSALAPRGGARPLVEVP